jgi:hypothetical protein
MGTLHIVPAGHQRKLLWDNRKECVHHDGEAAGPVRGVQQQSNRAYAFDRQSC